MGRVIYLTGAPATGKSSLCRALKQVTPDLVVVSYSSMLQDHLRERLGVSMSAIEMRQQSGAVVTRTDVADVDVKLLRLVDEERQTHDIIIDSHPVTKESYGFRVAPFTADQIKALNPDAIVCLYASPDLLHDRIGNAPDGRSLPSEFELGMHVQTQTTVATQYSVLTGRSCYLIDSGATLDALVERVLPILKLANITPA